MGSFTLHWTASLPHLSSSCAKTVLVEPAVPTMSTSWGHIKALYRD